MQQGWIKLHRKIQDHWIYQEKRKFSKYEAWLDILMMANHKNNKIMLGNELIEVEKGSFITSELKLMDRWGWGKEKLRTFLKLLENDGMIIKKSDRKKTMITICNYCVYHAPDEEIRPQTDHKQTMNRLSADTNKNVKNDKNDKNELINNIVVYLNEQCGTKFKPTTKSTQQHINARINEGYMFDDFKTVIDHKAKEWIGTQWEEYLRPATLFAGKFESYLNAAGKGVKKSESNRGSHESLYEGYDFGF